MGFQLGSLNKTFISFYFYFETRKCALAMDPVASELVVHRGKKRKNIAPLEDEQAKRRKTLPESEGKPRICIMLDLFQQPITLNALMELLHYAALGKAGGMKKPR